MQGSRWTHQGALLTLWLVLIMVTAAPVSSQAGSYSITLLADSDVTENSVLNNGTAPTLEISWNFSYIRSYLKFDLGPIPGNEVVTGATLNLFCTFEFNNIYNDAIYVNNVPDTSWTELGITGQNAPPFDPVELGRFFADTNAWAQFDLPVSYLASLPEAIFSLGLKCQFENFNHAWLFCSKENSVEICRPFLTVTTEGPLVPLPGTAFLLGGGLVLLWSTRERKEV